MVLTCENPNKADKRMNVMTRAPHLILSFSCCLNFRPTSSGYYTTRTRMARYHTYSYLLLLISRWYLLCEFETSGVGDVDGFRTGLHLL